MVEFRGVSKVYPNGTMALKDVNLTVEEGIPFIEDYFMNNEYVYGRFTHQMGWQDFSEKYKEVIGEEWRMLSSTEWQYLLEKRQMTSSSAPRYLNATDGPVIISGVKYYGLLIFPDDYEGATTSLTSIPEGCVFLPVTGNRAGTSVDIDDDGRYWSSSPNTSFAYRLFFYSSSVVTPADQYGLRYHGNSVRLVQDVK